MLGLLWFGDVVQLRSSIVDTAGFYGSPSHEKKKGGGLGVYSEVISYSILRVDRGGMNKYRLKRVFIQNYPVLFSGSVSTFAQSQLI